MTSGEGSTQAGLGEFDSGSGDRPAAEARAVAGDGDGSHAVVDPADERYPDAQERVDIAVTQVDYTLTGSGHEERPILHVFGRTGEDGREREHVRVHEFRPYFYAPTDSIEEADLADVDAITGWEETDDEGEPYESIRGERLTKIFGRTPRDVGEVRDRFDHFEADILFPDRFLIDKDIRSGIRVPERRSDDGAIDIPHEEIDPVDATADLRVLTFDIEVDDRRGFPEDGEEPIVCLSSHDSYREEYVAWLYNAPDGEVPPPEDVAGHDLLDEEATVEVRAFESEEGMLSAFMDYIEETDADLMTGWNFEDFDAPYLIDRLDVLGLDSDRLSRVDEVWSGGYGGPNIKGRVVFDLLYAYQRTKFTELDSYRLDDVAEMELGVGKERYPGDIGDLWEEDPKRLLEYNVRDVELCVELDRKQEIVAFWDEARKIVGCKIEDATTPGDAVDMYVLHEAHGEFALPSKGRQETEEFEGGAVFDPITGVKEMVSVLDLKSLYPMSMTTINASPETQVDPDVYDGETYRTPTGIHFRKEPDGIIREMVDELLDEREEKKALRNDHDPGSSEYERYDRQQAAVKVIMNCFTPDTDVLTPDGVRNIRDLEVGDPVYSLDPDAMEMEVKPVTETHAYPDYRGELVDIETSKIDFRVTPNHRMLVRKNDKNGITENGWSFVEAGDLYDYCHYEMAHGWDYDHADTLGESINLVNLVSEYTDLSVTVSDGGAKMAAQGGSPNVMRSISTDDFLEFLAWFITEGSVYHAETGNYRVQIAQQDGEIRKEIESFVRTFVDYYYVNEQRISFSSRVWAEILESLCGDSSENKRIPEVVFQASEEQKRRFLDTLIEGDGDWQENAWRFTTISDELRDDVLRLCTHLGLTASHNHDGEAWRIYVTENGKNTFRMHRSGSRSTAENGVYCVTVEDNHTLLAGRNGKYQFSHNSLYGVFGWDRFRLYDREMSAGVTSTNREVIEFTEKAANELDKEVIYGDTDSVMLELGHETSKPDAIERSFEIEEHINERYDEFAREELNATTHRFQIEFEKLYRRFFQAGKKKRYAGHIVWKEGKDVDDIDITGFEYQRSDIAPITKKVQREVLEMIVTGESTETVTEYVHDVIERFQQGDADIEEIGIPGGIGKRLNNYETDTAQVRGAKYANLLLGTNFGRGSKPKRLYLEKVHPDFWKRFEAENPEVTDDPLYLDFKRDPDVICFQYADQVPEEFRIDYDEMLEKTLKGPIARVIEALGMSWDEVASGQEQTGLGSFM